MKNGLLFAMLIAMCLVSLVESIAAAGCGPVDRGWLPNRPHAYCLGTKVQRYDYCGRPAGYLEGLKDHPAMCGDSTFDIEKEWQPKAHSVQLCKNTHFNQCATRAGTTRCRELYSQNLGWEWTPNPSTVCSGQGFTQTSNCGYTRTKVGTKQCCNTWTPEPESVCDGEAFTQTNYCGEQRQATGTKFCCTNETWSPQSSSMCSGITFTQTSSCGATRQVVGTGSCIKRDDSKAHLNEGDFPHDPLIARLTSDDLIGSPHINSDATNRAKFYHRTMPDNRSGSWEYYPVEVIGTNLDYATQMPVFTGGSMSDDFLSFLNTFANNSLLNNPQPTDKVQFCLDTDIPLNASNVVTSTCVDTGTRESTCGTHTIQQSCACAFDTKGTLYPLCDECTGPMTRNVSYTVTPDNNWVPARNTVCDTQTFTQTNDCGQTRQVTGTKDCGDTPPPPPPEPLEWRVDHARSIAIPRSYWPDFDGKVFGSTHMCLTDFRNADPNSHKGKLWAVASGIGAYPCNAVGSDDFCYTLGFESPPVSPPDPNCTSASFFECPVQGNKELVTFDITSFICD